MEYIEYTRGTIAIIKPIMHKRSRDSENSFLCR